MSDTLPPEVEEAFERLNRGCERNGRQCRHWHTYPYNICLSCLDDNQFYPHRFERSKWDAEIADTIRSHIGWQDVTIEALQAISEWTAEKQARLEALEARRCGDCISNDSCQIRWRGLDSFTDDDYCSRFSEEVPYLQGKRGDTR